MTDEQINRAIAEACGWTDVQLCTCCDYVRRGKPPGKTLLKHLEDYCNDLNAMHEAEKVLTELQCTFFRTHLRERLEHYAASRYIWHATARQRAVAFLSTLGKWKEVQK